MACEMRALLSFACVLLAHSFPAAQEERPNVLFVVVDDLNDWVGFLGGHPDAHTPNLDRLAARGVVFRNAHCQAPICGPSRASMWSGRLPSTTGIYGQVRDRDLRADESPLRDAVFLSEHFAAEGYATLGVGKLFHSGGGPGAFQEYGGGNGGSGPKPAERFAYDPAWFDKTGRTQTDWGAFPERDEDMPDWKTASWAVEQLAAEHDGPFFLAVGFVRPHVPWYVPGRWFERFERDELALPPFAPADLADVPPIASRINAVPMMPTTEWAIEADAWRDIVHAYLACVAFVDAQIGRVLDALEASPYADDTLIVLCSDHGYHLGEKNRFSKQTVWERSTRVPLIVVEPGSENGSAREAPVGLVDLYPTLVELAGLPEPDGLDGHSLVPLLRDPEAAWPHVARTSYGQHVQSIRDGRHRLIQYPDGSRELYDHADDADEWHNLAGTADASAELESLAGALLPEMAPLSSISRYDINGWFRGERPPQQANGIKIGEVDATSARVWTRATEWHERLLDGLEWPSDGRPLEHMRHAVPGAAGELRVRVLPEFGDELVTAWVAVDGATDSTHTFAIDGLAPGARYRVVCEARATPDGSITSTTEGSFRTAHPDAVSDTGVLFTMSTCQDFPRRDHPDSGHLIYRTMRGLDPDFFVHAGDLLYYDKPGPLAKTIELARHKWNRLYALPFLREFHAHTPTFFLRDDHDLLRNDCWPGQSYGELTWEDGLALLHEQLPIGEVPYRLVQWDPRVDVWLLEGREYRSPNNLPDGPDKTILGDEQWAWLERTLAASEAPFRFVVSATPIVGPDRASKGDNHANAAFAHEGRRLRELLARHGAVVLCGDRHWQYASRDPETGLREFGCGPASDRHAGGYPSNPAFPPDFVRLAGGFLSVRIEADGDGSGRTSAFVRHHDVLGEPTHEARLGPVER